MAYFHCFSIFPQLWGHSRCFFSIFSQLWGHFCRFLFVFSPTMTRVSYGGTMDYRQGATTLNCHLSETCRPEYSYPELA